MMQRYRAPRATRSGGRPNQREFSRSFAWYAFGMRPSRHVRWSALTCRLRDTDIHLGLAASLDGVFSDLVSARQMVAFPLQPVHMTVRDEQPTPLRVLAVRDPRLIEIEPDPSSTVAETEAGFRRVVLTVRLDRATPPNVDGSPSAAQAKASTERAIASAAAEVRPVMAFLLTVGLPIHEEDAFFTHVLDDFVSKSWMTFPKLLRELGCTTAEHVAEGGCDACPS
jgi:hypothetical protein